jgi:hypothetical protein
MTHYKNLEGHSGVTGYDVGENYIKVEFNHDAVYLYTFKSAGKKVIDNMKKLAVEGKGLSTYISQTVRDRYEKKL